MMRYAILFLFLIILSSCKEGIDVTAPEIGLSGFSHLSVSMEVCGVIEDEVFKLKSSEKLSLRAVFRDDVALSQYKIDIHQNFDCHGHGDGTAPGVSLPDLPGQTEDWTLIEIGELEGEEVEKIFQWQVPENVTAGNYHFSIQVIDLAGNPAERTDIFSMNILNIKDTIAPILEINSPTERNMVLDRGDIFTVRGILSDNYSLSEGGNGLVFMSYLNLNTGNTFSTNSFKVFTTSSAQEYFELQFTIPATLSRGKYRFVVGAFDGVRNASETEHFLIEVK